MLQNVGHDTMGYQTIRQGLKIIELIPLDSYFDEVTFDDGFQRHNYELFIMLL